MRSSRQRGSFHVVPIYEYVCKSCDAKFEQLVRSMGSAESAKTKCPSCGSMQTSRALSVFAVGAEASSGGASGKMKGNSPPPGMCGRCGGPGPCPSGY
jgi:putative FmdB family regulatory protein